MIATLDLGRPAEAARLGQEMDRVGLVRVSGDPAVAAVKAYRPLQKAFFSLPLEEKLELRWTGRTPVQGYVAFSSEHLDETAPADAKECFNVNHRRFDVDGHPFVLPMHLWPAALPDFREATVSLALALDALAHRIFRLLAVHMGLPVDFLSSRHSHESQTLRLLHYPVGSGRAGAGMHRDHSTLTLLDFDQDGLEAEFDGWKPVPPVPGTLLVFSGDMLRHWSGGRTHSVTHRVGVPTHPRNALAWFCQADDEVLLTGIADTSPTISAGEFMRRRALARHERYVAGR